MKIRSIILVLACALFFVACEQSSKILRTPSGYDYSLINNSNGPTANPGDYVSFEMEITDDKGKVLQARRSSNPPQGTQIPDEGFTGDPNPIMDVLAVTAAGDTAVLVIPTDSMPGNNPMLKDVAYVNYKINVLGIEDMATYTQRIAEEKAIKEAAGAEAKARESEVAAKIAETLANYKNGTLKDLVKLPSGLEYVVHEKGDGTMPQSGETVNAHYYGVTKKEGNMFDNSFKRGQEFSFNIGTGQVIKGWDEGMAQYPRGSKATIFIPYMMAYGEAGRPPTIPAKADLVFYVELIK